MLTQLRAIYDRFDKTSKALALTTYAFRILEFQAVAGRIHQEAVVEYDARQVRLSVFDPYLCHMCRFISLHFFYCKLLFRQERL